MLMLNCVLRRDVGYFFKGEEELINNFSSFYCCVLDAAEKDL